MGRKIEDSCLVWARSSVVERFLDAEEVGSSILLAPTILLLGTILYEKLTGDSYAE